MHIDHSERRLKDIRSREKDRVRDEEKLKKDLAKIEELALAAMAKDYPTAEVPVAAVQQRPNLVPIMPQGAPLDPGQRDMQKHNIQETIEAKRRRVDDGGTLATSSASASSSASGAAVAQPAVPVPAAPGSTWLVATDPNSGHVYYYNQADGTSSWTLPQELADRAAPAPTVQAAPASHAQVDLSKPPPPPEKKPPPPPARPGKGGINAPVVGMWEEVKPEDSMWGRPGVQQAEMDEDEYEAHAANPTTELKAELMTRRGEWAPEDMEVHEKEVVEKRSLYSGAASFPMARKKASGIRRKTDDD